MYCIRRLTRTWGSSGTVSGTFSLSREFQATFNVVLGRAIGVHMTSEFALGLARTTSFSDSDEISCGSPDIAPCSWTNDFIQRVRQDGWSTIRARWRAYARCVRPGYVSAWVPITDVCRESTVRIDGTKYNDSHCLSEDRVCPRSQAACCPGG